MKKIDNLIIGIIILAVILINLVFWNHFFNPDFGADQRLYWNQGLYLYKNGQFLYNPAFGLYESFLPFIIFLLINVFGESYFPIICYNILLYAVMLCIIYIFSKNVFSSRLWAIIVLLLTITNNTYIQFNFFVARETSTITFLTIFCMGFYYYFKDKGKWLLLFLSLLSAIILFNDNRYYPYFFLFVIIWGTYNLKAHKGTKNITVYLVLILLFLLPWSIRNYKVNGYFLPFAEVRASGYLRFIPEKVFKGKNRGKLSLWASNADRAGMNGDSSLLNQIPLPIDTGYAAAGYHNLITEQKYNDLNNKKSKSWLSVKFDQLKSFWAFSQFKYKIGPGNDDRIYPPWSLIKNINEIVHTGLLLPFFFAGLWVALRQKKIIIISLATLVLFHTLLHVFLGANLIRYRYHIMPLFTIVSAYGIFVIFDPFLKRLSFLRKLYTKLT
jgi:hypothetical protein